MAEKHDKLGRRIPQFDRSAASKKGAKTQKEKYGPDFHSRVGADGGSRGRSGGFAYLKTKNPKLLREISSKGGHSGVNYFAKLKTEDPEKFREISSKGGKASTSKDSTNGGGGNAPVPKR